MPGKVRRKPSLTNLLHLLDYFRYLYEEEQKRNEKLSSATNTYLVVITFAFSFLGGLMSWLSPGILEFSTAPNHPVKFLLLAGLLASIVLILVSLILTMLAIKVRAFERLCSPMDYASEASQIRGEEGLIRSMISNYVVAADRNHHWNNVKARYLSYGLQFYLVGFALLLLTLLGIFAAGR